MKNLRFFPHERNQFFKGKLLTVRDFESEQRYFNDKRRLVNRLMHGGGVVCGLQVIQVDEKQISIEAGVAFDYLGREIVVPEPIKQKLSMLEGFTNNEYAKNVYICLEYDEKSKEQVFSVADTIGQESADYNRVAEGYRLFIREEAPHPATFERNQLVEQRVLLYQDQQLCIWQATPRYVRTGETFTLYLHIEKTVQTPRVQFQYRLESPMITTEEGEECLISFTEEPDAKQTDYTIGIHLRAGNQVGTTSLDVKNGRAELLLGDKAVQLELSNVGKLQIISEPVEKRILQDFTNRSLDQVTQLQDQPCIYLAKVCLLQMNATYIIDKVIPLPFDEVVYTPALLQQLDHVSMKKEESTNQETVAFRASARTSMLGPTEKPSLSISYEEQAREYLFHLALPRQVQHGEQITSGVVELPIDRFASHWPFSGVKTNNRYFSEEISHGLGKGSVFVHVGVESSQVSMITEMLSHSEQVYYGNTSVFEDSEFTADAISVSIGTIVYPRKGTFRIGIRLKSPIQADHIRLRWWAVKNVPALVPKASAVMDVEDSSVSSSSVDEAAAGTTASGEQE